MPLMRTSCSPYYMEHINSDDVKDSIVKDRKHYPIIDLCLSNEFTRALKLLSKGYRCLHEDNGIEAARLMRLTSSLDHASVEKKSTSAIIDAMYEEIKILQQSDENGYISFINSFGFNLIKLYSYRRRSRILSYIRRSMPDVYSSMIKLGNWDLSTLIEFDHEFVEEYMLRLTDTSSVGNYTELNKISEEDTLHLLLSLFKCDDSDTLEVHMENLFEICMSCHDIYPSGFTCDVAILTMIKMFRIDMYANSDVSPSDFDTISPFRENVGRFNRLISFHMRKDYSLYRVIHTLIVAYQSYDDGLSTYVESDFYLLDDILHHTKVCLPHIKVSLSADLFELADNAWKYEHIGEEVEFDSRYTEYLDHLKKWHSNNHDSLSA